MSAVRQRDLVSQLRKCPAQLSLHLVSSSSTERDEAEN